MQSQVNKEVTFLLLKKQFKLLFPLLTKQPWLARSEEQLESLIFNECNSAEQQELILDLLKRFCYLDTLKFQEKLNDLALSIVTDTELTDDTTIVVAVASGNGSDSSQYILYTLKPLFEKLGWRNYAHLSTFDRIASFINKNEKNYRDIVLVDEFIGSGQTIIGRVKTIKERLNDAGINDYSIRVKVVASTSYGLQELNKESISVETLITLHKGISDFYQHSQRAEKIDQMLELESILSEEYAGRELPSLGFNRAEALYGRDDGNSPNSVFPIFWWRFYKSGGVRNTLLTRAMRDA